MPCTDWDDAKPVSASEYVSMERRAHELEAMLCAVFTELEKDLNPVDMREFIESAEINGQCNIKEFWLAHKKEDELRLRKDLSKYSKHEIEVLRKILISDDI